MSYEDQATPAYERFLIDTQMMDGQSPQTAEEQNSLETVTFNQQLLANKHKCLDE